MVYLALALTWLVVSTAFAVLVGKCIAAGVAAGAARPVPAEAAVPAQRWPSETAGLAGQDRSSALRA